MHVVDRILESGNADLWDLTTGVSHFELEVFRSSIEEKNRKEIGQSVSDDIKARVEGLETKLNARIKETAAGHYNGIGVLKWVYSVIATVLAVGGLGGVIFGKMEYDRLTVLRKGLTVLRKDYEEANIANKLDFRTLSAKMSENLSVVDTVLEGINSLVVSRYMSEIRILISSSSSSGIPEYIEPVLREQQSQIFEILDASQRMKERTGIGGYSNSEGGGLSNYGQQISSQSGTDTMLNLLHAIYGALLKDIQFSRSTDNSATIGIQLNELEHAWKLPEVSTYKNELYRNYLSEIRAWRYNMTGYYHLTRFRMFGKDKSHLDTAEAEFKKAIHSFSRYHAPYSNLGIVEHERFLLLAKEENESSIALKFVHLNRAQEYLAEGRKAVMDKFMSQKSRAVSLNNESYYFAAEAHLHLLNGNTNSAKLSLKEATRVLNEALALPEQYAALPTTAADIKCVEIGLNEPVAGHSVSDQERLDEVLNLWREAKAKGFRRPIESFEFETLSSDAPILTLLDNLKVKPSWKEQFREIIDPE